MHLFPHIAVSFSEPLNANFMFHVSRYFFGWHIYKIFGYLHFFGSFYYNLITISFQKLLDFLYTYLIFIRMLFHCKYNCAVKKVSLYYTKKFYSICLQFNQWNKYLKKICFFQININTFIVKIKDLHITYLTFYVSIFTIL